MSSIGQSYPLEVQRVLFIPPLPHSSKYWKFYHFMVTVPKTASDHTPPTNTSLSVCHSLVGHCPCRFIFYHLCEKVLFHTLQEPPSLPPCCRVDLTGDISGLKSPTRTRAGDGETSASHVQNDLFQYRMICFNHHPTPLIFTLLDI